MSLTYALFRFRCSLPGIDTANHTEPWNSSLLHDFIPLNDNGKLKSCSFYKGNGTLTQCQNWVYDTQYVSSSRGIEWNFVCKRRWMGAVGQTVYMFGVVVGSIVIGRLSDKFGRKSVFRWAAICQFCFNMGVAFTTEYYTFLVIRFICGIFGNGPYLVAFVLNMELIGPNKRTVCGVMFQVMFACGVVLLGLWGYLITHVFYLQVAFSLHTLLLLPHWFLMDESPRWLWSQGRARESIAIVSKALKINKSSEVLDIPKLVSQCNASRSKFHHSSEATTASLFKTPNMRKITLIICAAWFASSVVYYGLSLNTGQLNKSPYLSISLLGIIEVPSSILLIYSLDWLGHRAITSGSLLLGGLACLVVTIIPQGSIFLAVMVMVGKFFISLTHSIVYKYSAELFPTVVRSSGVGLGVMSACFSGALSPLVTLLDSLDPKIPTIVFGLLALLSGISTLFLPETCGHQLPETLDDGERFGLKDTCFTNCRGKLIQNSIYLREAKPLTELNVN